MAPVVFIPHLHAICQFSTPHCVFFRLAGKEAKRKKRKSKKKKLCWVHAFSHTYHPNIDLLPDQPSRTSAPLMKTRWVMYVTLAAFSAAVFRACINV